MCFSGLHTLWQIIKKCKETSTHLEEALASHRRQGDKIWERQTGPSEVSAIVSVVGGGHTGIDFVIIMYFLHATYKIFVSHISLK